MGNYANYHAWKLMQKSGFPQAGINYFFSWCTWKIIAAANRPIQSFQAASFGISQGQVSNLFKSLNGLLSTTLKKMDLVPAKNNEELQSYLEKHKIKELYKDATERSIARKSDYEAQKQDYSGKKKHIQLRTL